MPPSRRLPAGYHLGIGYLTVVMDWYSRYVLSWRLSNTLDGQFCLEALEEALTCGTPEIFNTDQGVQYTAAAFTGRLESAGVAISMDGRGRWLDNVFVERLWRTVKYEYIYLHDHATVRALEAGLAAKCVYFARHSRHARHRQPLTCCQKGTCGCDSSDRKRVKRDTPVTIRRESRRSRRLPPPGSA